MRWQTTSINNYAEERFNLASIPFRFKAGGDGKMPAPVAVHSHRSTTKVSHKAFKARKATKGALKEISKGMVPTMQASNIQTYNLQAR
jgi:pre-rRNA-processing protein TSR1